MCADVRNGELRLNAGWRSSGQQSQADIEPGLSQLSQADSVPLSQQSNFSRPLFNARDTPTPRPLTRGRPETLDSVLLRKCAALLRQYRHVEYVPLFKKELVWTSYNAEQIAYYSTRTRYMYIRLVISLLEKLKWGDRNTPPYTYYIG